jgi:hypothetical protein
MQAHAYSCELEMFLSLLASAFSKLSASWWMPYVNFRAAAPDGHGPVAAVAGLELADVLAELLDHLGLRGALLDVRAVQAADELGIEDAGHRNDGFQFGADGVEVLAGQDVGVDGGVVGVVGEDVPGAEDEVVQLGELQEVADARRAVVGALAEADGAHLRERADRFAEAFAGQEHAGNHGGGDGPEAGQQNSEFPACGLDGIWLLHDKAEAQQNAGHGLASGATARRRACSNN